MDSIPEMEKYIALLKNQGNFCTDLCPNTDDQSQLTEYYCMIQIY